MLILTALALYKVNAVKRKELAPCGTGHFWRDALISRQTDLRWLPRVFTNTFAIERELEKES